MEKLTDSNFYVWKQKIQLLLSLKDVDQQITDDAPSDPSTEESRRKWLRDDNRAKALIGLSLSDEHLEHVRDAKTAKDMWQAILNVFERHTLLNRLAARRQFYTVTMQNDEKVLTYINRVNQLAARLKSMNVDIDDKEMAMAVLNGLPARFESLIVALDALGNEEKMFTLEFVKSRLLQEEQRTAMKDSQSRGSALINKINRTPNSSRAPNDWKCTNCGHTGHTATRCWGKDIDGRRPPAPTNYKSRNNNNNRKPSAFVSQQRDKSNIVVINDAGYTCLMTKISEGDVPLRSTSWLIDSACTAHMTFDRSTFVTYKPMKSATVEMGTKAQAVVAGCGDVVVQLNVNGRKMPCKLKDVLHVPEFGYSLLSVPKLTANGFKAEFGNPKCIIKHGSNVVASATLIKNMYVLDEFESVASAHVASLQTWHERLAHVHTKGIASMIQNNVVSGINVPKSDLHRTTKEEPNCNSVTCAACVYGKATRAVIPKVRSTGRALFPLDLVHSDICGPLEIQSIGGAKYFITFIDDHTNWSVVYPMSKKSDTFHYFKIFAQLAHTHTGRKIKVLRTDRGGEYLSKEFELDLNSKGTQHQFTTAYTPEQNGVAERLNRTLINLVRSMLVQKQVNKRFWAEALDNAVYVRNRVTSRALPKNTTPHHLWTGKKPDVSHLRVFGSKCWYTLPGKQLQKLDARARQAMFLGYAKESKAYKLWDSELRKVVMSRDVTFDETGYGPNGNIADATLDMEGDEDFITLDIAQGGESNRVGDEDTDTGNEDVTNNENINNDIGTPSPENTNDPELQMPPPASSSNPSTPLRRSTRVRKPPTKWWTAMLAAGLLSHTHVMTSIPNSYREAVTSPKAAFWQKGIDKELVSHAKNSTWTLVPRSEAKNLLTSRWVFAVKQLPDDTGKLTETAKGRLVARGFQQIEGIDYTETFAPVIKFTTIRMLLALVAHFDLELHQMDVVTAFLNGDLDEDIYMEQPEGYVISSKPKSDFVCKLLKAVYGLKQAHRQWHAKIDDFLIGDLGFMTTRSDPCLYIKRHGSSVMIIALYVDDLLLAGSDIKAIGWMKQELSKRFEMKDLGEAKLCIGLEIQRDRSQRNLRLTQAKYAASILERFNLSKCNPCLTPMDQSRAHSDQNKPKIDSDDPPTNAPYREAIGCLMFLMVGTRPDLAYAIGKLSQHCADPRRSHWLAVKHVLRYVHGTQNIGIEFVKSDSTPKLNGYSDADWGGCHESRKSTSGFVFKLCGGAVSWASRRQTVVATSTCEAEYIALCEACKEAAWLRRVLADVLGHTKDPTLNIGCDNAGTIAYAHSEKVNRRNKHVDIAYHFVRDAIKRNIVELYHCASTEMTADILTKPLGRVLFQKFVSYLGLAKSPRPTSM